MISTILLVLLYAFSPPCTTEDDISTLCHWSASEHGNHQGQSFVKIGEEYYY